MYPVGDEDPERWRSQLLIKCIVFALGLGVMYVLIMAWGFFLIYGRSWP